MLKKFKIGIKYSKISRSAHQNSKFRARNLSGRMLKKVQNMSIKIWRDYELALRCNNGYGITSGCNNASGIASGCNNGYGNLHYEM